MEAMDNIGKPTLSGLASRIRNIDGKPLRSAIRNVKPSCANDGKALHGAADAATVIRSPYRVSFVDNVRVSQINPNDTNMSSDMNKENPMVSVTNSDGVNVSPRVSIDANPKPASPMSYNDSFDIFGASRENFKPLNAAVEGNSGANVTYADMLHKTPNKKSVRLKELRNPEIVEGAAVALPMDAVDAISSRFANTLFGYFIGKRLAFPLVENYVKNTWAKYGLKRIQLHEGFFMFQFNTKEGMESVMENGPWLIRYVPLILNVWTPNTDLKKDVIKTAPLWVKLHHVPIVAYSEVGLSLITTQLGRPLMLDSYTSSMCLSSWGRNTYARALVEFSAEEELKDSLVIAIPRSNGKGHSLATIEVEYEWTPPRCSTCKVFDHINDSCPKNPKVVTNDKEKDDGFIKVTKKNSKAKPVQKNKQIEGIRLSKPALNLQYRKVDKGETSKKNDSNKTVPNKGKVQTDNATNAPIISTKNSFDALSENEDLEFNSTRVVNEDSDDEAVDEVLIFDDRQGQSFVTKGASTPVTTVSND
ncbi:zinc knuckle CX2CX4HX4C containing protein [Tanacetum coccineum]